MKIELADGEIDLARVCEVGKVHGDEGWERYTLKFEDDAELEVYDSREEAGGTPLNQYNREDLFTLWEKVYKNYP